MKRATLFKRRALDHFRKSLKLVEGDFHKLEITVAVLVYVHGSSKSRFSPKSGRHKVSYTPTPKLSKS